MIGHIYFLEDNNTKTPFYVGSTFCEKTRYKQHLNMSKYEKNKLYSFIRERKIEFNLCNIESVDVTKKELCKLEQYWIYQFKTWGFNLLNSNHTKNPINPFAINGVNIRISKEVHSQLKEFTSANKLQMGLFVKSAIHERIAKESKKAVKP